MIVSTDLETQILKIFSIMSDKLGVVGAHLWEVLIRQQLIYGYFSLIGSILCFVVFLALIFVSIKYRNSIDIYEIGTFFIFSSIGILFFLSGSLFYAALTRIMNPEYGAFADIVEKVQGK